MKLYKIRASHGLESSKYIDVRQSDLTLIPPFLAGLNKFYEKKVLQGIKRGTI